MLQRPLQRWVAPKAVSRRTAPGRWHRWARPSRHGASDFDPTSNRHRTCFCFFDPFKPFRTTNRARTVDTPSNRRTPAQTEALQARFALRVSARLDDAAQALPHDITERLRIARMQAVDAARAAAVRTVVTAPTPVAAPQTQWVLAGAGAGSGSTPTAATPWHHHNRRPDHGRNLDDAPTGWGWRVASALPLLALVVGLWGINQWYQQQQVEALTDVDIALLTDELPPTAYTDPGFEEFLRVGTDVSTQPEAAERLPQLPEAPAEAAPVEAPAINS